MSKILFGLFFLLLIVISPRLILAANITTNIIDPNPPDIFTDTPKITVAITSDENSFDPNTGYTYSAWNVSKGEASCAVGEYSKNPITRPTTQFSVTSNKITISWEAGQGCRAETGEYNFQLWAGKGNIDRNSNSLIGKPQTLSFKVQQKGGGEPKLSPLHETILLGTEPTVLVSNARIGNSYAFWWDSSQFTLAASKKNISAADLKNGILFVKLKLTDSDSKIGVPRKLCMEISGNDQPRGLTCHYYTFFNFSNVTIKYPTQCTILPSITPTITDDVSLQITDAVPETTYVLVVKKDGDEFKTIPTQIVDEFGNLTVSIGQKLFKGNYTTHVLDRYTAKTLDPCSLGFNVGTEDTAGKDICKIQPDKCSRSGGTIAPGCTTDQNNPGIATAIGCIHTNPTELVKDLMTFLVGIGGGLAFLMMLGGVFQMMSSGGNPEAINAGKSRLTSAVIGLLIVIFATLLLQIIGVDILQIPGFNR